MLSDYRKYKNTKEYFEFEYRGYDLAPIMATILTGIIFEKKKTRLFKTIKNLFRIKSFEPLNFKIKPEQAFIAFSNDQRKDNQELINAYIRKLNIKATRSKIVGSENILILNTRHYIDSWHKVKDIKGISWKEKVYLWTTLISFLNLIDYLDAHPLKLPTEYYSYNSSYGYETVLTQYFRLQGIKTYSFQHGMYYVLPEKESTLDVIHYENLTADYMLCWGEYSKREMIKCGIDEKRLIVFGNPKYTEYVHYTKHRKKFNRVLVTLARRMFDEQNSHLIELIANIKDISFEIKRHPSLNREYYERLIRDKSNVSFVDENLILSECLHEDYDFIIAYNTTAYYEACAYGKITFDYLVEDNRYVLEEFNSLQDLKGLIERYEHKTEEEIDISLAAFAKDTLGAS